MDAQYSIKTPSGQKKVIGNFVDVVKEILKTIAKDPDGNVTLSDDTLYSIDSFMVYDPRQ